MGFIKEYYSAITGRGEEERQREQELASLERAADGRPDFYTKLSMRDTLAKAAKNPIDLIEAYRIPDSRLIPRIRQDAKQKLEMMKDSK